MTIPILGLALVLLIAFFGDPAARQIAAWLRAEADRERRIRAGRPMPRRTR